jgi:hypothetical protein
VPRGLSDEQRQAFIDRALRDVGMTARGDRNVSSSPVPNPRPQAPGQQVATLGSQNGVTVTLRPAMSVEHNIDRPGSDYRSFELAANAGAEICQQTCESEATVCRAYTYVRAGVQGANPRCSLKSAVPAGVARDCCVSGVAIFPDPQALERAIFGR